MHVGLSLLAIEHNDLDAAADHLLSSAELGEHMGLPQHPYRWRVAMARLREAQGDLDSALELLDTGRGSLQHRLLPHCPPGQRFEGQDRGQAAETSTRRKVGGATAGSPRDDELSYVREFEHITLAGVLLARRVRARRSSRPPGCSPAPHRRRRRAPRRQRNRDPGAPHRWPNR